MELRPYQQNAIAKIRQAYIEGERSILVVSPTGSGKGIILSELIRSATERGSRVLFIVHRREILFQVSAHMNRLGISHGIVMASEPYDYGHKVDLATIQTISRRMKNRTYDMADVIIIDEAHHATADTYQEVVGAYQKNLLVGFTATPCRDNGFGLGHLFRKMVTVATIQELTDLGYLVPVRYYAPSEPDLTGIKITAGDYNEKQLENVMNKPKLVGDVVENWIRIGENRQTVIFTTTVAHSLAVCKAFNDVGIVADHVDGKTNKAERNDVLDRFRSGQIRVLCNCSVFTEGVDIPDISCVVMARPTKSLALYMQTIGRGMRPSSQKKDMIYIDHAGACYEHGAVHEITEWTLDVDVKNTNKKNEERKAREAKPITCDTCSCVYTGRLKCPDCGTIPDMKKYGKDVAYIDAKLGEVCFVTKTAKIPKATLEEKQHWYSELIWYARQKGYKPGWVYHQYRKKFGVAPVKVKDIPIPTTQEVLAWIRGQAARHAIARQHTKNQDEQRRA